MTSVTSLIKELESIRESHGDRCLVNDYTIIIEYYIKVQGVRYYEREAGWINYKNVPLPIDIIKEDEIRICARLAEKNSILK